MNKKLLLTLIALNTTQLLCSETALHSHPAKVSPEGAQAGSASLYTAGTSSVKHFSYTIQPSNQITEEEAYKHQDLINAAFKPTSLEIKKPYTFLYELNKKRDVIVSAYETDAKTHQRVLVGGLFGTKYRNSAGCSEPPGFVKTETAINSIYVSDRVQRQGIGTQMVKLLKEYAKNLPIALYVKTINIRGKAFWASQHGFEKSSHWIAYGLLKDDDPDTSLEPKDVIAYYSENNSGEALYVDSSDEEVL